MNLLKTGQSCVSYHGQTDLSIIRVKKRLSKDWFVMWNYFSSNLVEKKLYPTRCATSAQTTPCSSYTALPGIPPQSWQINGLSYLVLDGLSLTDWQVINSIWTKRHTNWDMKTGYFTRPGSDNYIHFQVRSDFRLATGRFCK